MKHARVLRQLSSCSGTSSSKLQMYFTINLAFWQMCKERSPSSVSNIQPQYTEEVQTFVVSLYEVPGKILGHPTELETFMETMDIDGNRIPTHEEREAIQPLPFTIPRWLNNILVMTCTALTTVTIGIIFVLLAKHLKALFSGIALSTLPPPPVEALNLTAAAMASALIAQNPEIGTKVICSYPVAVVWQTF